MPGKRMILGIEKRAWLAFGFGVCGFVQAQLLYASPAACQLKVNVSKLRNASGQVCIALYQGEENYLNDEQALRHECFSLEEGARQAVFEKVVPGSYTVAVFHDEDGNRKFATNLLGIPTEGYGISNNARALFSAPSYEDAIFSVSEDCVYAGLDIEMNYLL